MVDLAGLEHFDDGWINFLVHQKPDRKHHPKLVMVFRVGLEQNFPPAKYNFQIMAKLLKPERLCFGDTIGIIAPASAPPDPKAVDRAAIALEKFGFRPKLGKNVRARLGFLAGTDRERAADVMQMFTDKKVKAIICLRGGDGSSRILDRLDYDVIRRNPKIFAGYSDITSLHFALA